MVSCTVGLPEASRATARRFYEQYPGQHRKAPVVLEVHHTTVVQNSQLINDYYCDHSQLVILDYKIDLKIRKTDNNFQ